MGKQKENLETDRETAWNEVEIQRLKGTVEATKHYYAVLIAKNVAKVEEVMNDANARVDAIDEYLKEISAEMGAIVQTIKRTRKKGKKEFLEREYDRLADHKSNLQGHRGVYLKMASSLRQVL